MSKLSIYITIISVFIISSAAIIDYGSCDVVILKKELKKELKPNYKYDSSKISRFIYKNNVQIKEIEVPLFRGEKYRFLFNTTGLPEDVKIEIYNKKKDNEKRKLLYTLDHKKGQNIYIHEPKKAYKMYINYTIPKSTETDLRGCLVFLLGYR